MKPNRRKVGKIKAPKPRGWNPAILLLALPVVVGGGYLVWDKFLRPRTAMEQFTDLVEEASQARTKEVSQVDPAYVSETLKLFRELRSRAGFKAHMGKQEKHEEDGAKIERALVEVDAHLRRQQVSHDDAIRARDTGYWLYTGYDIWTMSIAPKEGASPSEGSVIYGMRDRLKTRMLSIHNALSDRASKLDKSAVDRAEKETLGR